MVWSRLLTMEVLVTCAMETNWSARIVAAITNITPRVTVSKYSNDTCARWSIKHHQTYVGLIAKSASAAQSAPVFVHNLHVAAAGYQLQSIPAAVNFAEALALLHAVIVVEFCKHNASPACLSAAVTPVDPVPITSVITMAAISTAPPMSSRYSSAPCPFKFTIFPSFLSMVIKVM